MDFFTSRVLVLLLLVNTALGTVISPPKSTVTFENGPFDAWQCQTAEGQIQTIQTTPILRAANALVYLWDHKTHRRWPADANTYPQRVRTNEILHWPTESNEEPGDSEWLCDDNSWVGSYPIPVYNPSEPDPGPFRVLVSGSYKKEGTGGDVTYIFGFCGVAIRVGDKHEMCWPMEESDEEYDEQELLE